MPPKKVSRSARDLQIMKKLAKSHSESLKRFGRPKCKSGQILRAGFRRKSYTKKSGTRVKGGLVAPKCIKSRTGRPHGQQLFVLEKGSLATSGYKNVENLGAADRHRALKKACKKMGALSVYRMLMAVALVNRNVNPKLSKVFMKDAEWIKTTPEYKSRPTSIRKASRKVRKSRKASRKVVRKSRKVVRKSRKASRKVIRK